MSEAELLALLNPVPHGNGHFGSTAALVVERRIGKGQFSVVYRARAKVDGSVVALKKVQIFDMMDAKARVDCVKETNLLQVWHEPVNHNNGLIRRDLIKMFEKIVIILCIHFSF